MFPCDSDTRTEYDVWTRNETGTIVDCFLVMVTTRTDHDIWIINKMGSIMDHFLMIVKLEMKLSWIGGS